VVCDCDTDTISQEQNVSRISCSGTECSI
jgi:hypothetical protein